MECPDTELEAVGMIRPAHVRDGCDCLWLKYLPNTRDALDERRNVGYRPQIHPPKGSWANDLENCLEARFMNDDLPQALSSPARSPHRKHLFSEALTFEQDELSALFPEHQLLSTRGVTAVFAQ
jgi:hypothetical protein